VEEQLDLITAELVAHCTEGFLQLLLCRTFMNEASKARDNITV
jgi:hypothetical protein